MFMPSHPLNRKIVEFAGLCRIMHPLLPAPAQAEVFHAIDELDKDKARMDALERPGWELSQNDDIECAHWELWQVRLCTGGRNDREWTLLGQGATQREALDAAIANSK